MKNSYSLFTFLILFITSSCHSHNTANVDITEKLRSSPTFNKYLELNIHLANGLKNGTYNYAHLNKTDIRDHNADFVDKLPADQLYTIYASAGMTNTKDYIDTQISLNKYYEQLMKEYPELLGLSIKDRVKLFKKVRILEKNK
ncbi:hypothetical protein [Mucilaginibacter lappiensis]|uniref:DUF4296 domain-containing protein n=1 Tax=Mucilaginibacter lappiensis TaxID=354630 RepID=A0A841J5D0_9SPHI|nr:hypothetical protein [Mucilaginibacter lappiensis]MBB6125994.1 hypothetical protein [Mucilaginibacter lappiensis]